MTPFPPRAFGDVGAFGRPRYRRASDPTVELEERGDSGEFDLFVDGRQVGSLMHGPHGRLLSDAAPGRVVDRMLAAVRGEDVDVP